MKCRPEVNNNREAVVVCARHVVKRSSKCSALVIFKTLYPPGQVSIVLESAIEARNNNVFDGKITLLCIFEISLKILDFWWIIWDFKIVIRNTYSNIN